MEALEARALWQYWKLRKMEGWLNLCWINERIRMDKFLDLQVETGNFSRTEKRRGQHPYVQRRGEEREGAGENRAVRGGTQNTWNLFIKKCVFILTCLNFSLLQSTFHVMQYIYRDIFPRSKQFWNPWILLLPFFVLPLFHISKMFPF